MRLAIAGGGTAGHVNPALALAHAFSEAEVVFFGTDRGVEAKLVPAAGFALEVLDIRGLDRARPLAAPGVALTAARAIGRARKLLKRMAPRAVVGMGGYVSLPVCLAARSLAIPVVLHEQNMVLGLANRVCKPFARAVGLSFEESVGSVGPKGRFVGNPVLPHVVDAAPERERAAGYARFDLDPHRKTVLFFGGSQGARTINEACSGVVASWREREDVQVLHIAGRAAAAEYKRRLPPSGSLIARVVDYVERMTEAYYVADVAVCRGGATTLAELGVVGLPALIVPYPFHRDRQQERHAEVWSNAGAGVTLSDADATPAHVAQEVDSLLNDEAQLGAMRAAARALGQPDAAARLADLVREHS